LAKNFGMQAFIGTQGEAICLFIEDRGRTLARNRKKRTSPPMLAKRFIVAAFAALAIGLTPLALPGERDLFVDVSPMPSIVAAN
jgi:hypothetical protein